MARTDYSRQIEQLEDLLAQLSAARSAQDRRLLKLRAVSDHHIYRMARHMRTDADMAAFEHFVEIILDFWDGTIEEIAATEAAQHYLQALRGKNAA